MARIQRSERRVHHKGDLVIGDFRQGGNQREHQNFLFAVRERLEFYGRAVLAEQRQRAVFADGNFVNLLIVGDFFVQTAGGLAKRIQFAAAQPLG